MPGISLKCDLNKKVNSEHIKDNDLFLNALNSLIHSEFYKPEILLRDEIYLIGSTRYPEYPVRIFENDEYWVCLEGRIYGKHDSVLKNEINQLMKSVFSNGDKKIISDWVFKTDGDFIIYALNKGNKDFIIMNDILGRLPIYYYCKDNHELLLSREIQFITFLVQHSDYNYDNHDKFDMMGIAQFLLFCHTLGKRTLLKDVYRLEPATLMTINYHNSEIKIDRLYQYNFENKKYNNESLKKNAQQLVSLFSEACKNRVDTNAKNLITLSGGFDSRTIASWFHKNKIQAYAATTVDPSWKPFFGNLSDAEVAKQIAKMLNVQWEYYHFVEPRAKDLDMLLRIKKGLTYLGYGFLIQFIDKLKHEHGSSAMNLFVGYSGDRIIADLSMRHANLDELIRSILTLRVFLPLEVVASLVQIKENKIIDELRNTLSSYPEQDLGQKLVHFIFYGRQFKFVFEAEDIHRLYFWIVNPFYSIPFFNYAMNCPDKHKSQQVLYREFLYLMSPLAAAINSSNWGCSILSNKFKAVQYILTLTLKYPMFKKFLKKFIKKNRDRDERKENGRIIQCMRDQLSNCDTISKYLSCKEIEKIMNNSSSYSQAGIYNLFTIMSLMERTLCNNSTIEKFYDG
jgi:asparagine synthase (glutamine-hydrolysing)